MEKRHHISGISRICPNPLGSCGCSANPALRYRHNKGELLDLGSNIFGIVDGTESNYVEVEESPLRCLEEGAAPASDYGIKKESATMRYRNLDPLRVLLVTEDDPLYVGQFFDVFFAELPRERIEIVGVTVSRAFHEPILKTARRIHRFYGTAEFLRLLPRYIVAKLRGQAIKTLALRHGFPLLAAASVNAPEYINTVKSLRPEIIISVAAPEIFKSPLLSLASIGYLNIHSGSIPEYRGMMPTFWQMLEGKDVATVTIHEMVLRLDAGGIVDTLTFPIEERDSLDRVISGTKQAGARLMIRVLQQIAERRTMPDTTPLDMSKSRLFKFPQPADVAKFRARGHRMI
jgi:methionyl-tRNA formyltransferase